MNTRLQSDDVKITGAEIARLTNVSRSTVSRVVNNYPNALDETRKKVLDMIEKYGYEPNSSAQVPAGKASRRITLFISDCDSSRKKWKETESPYFMRLVAKSISQGRQYEYTISVIMVTQKSDFAKIENMYLSGMIYGGVFVDFEFEMKSISELALQRFNMVTIDPNVDMIRAESIRGIYSQNQDAGYLAISYLIRQGHRQIVHLSEDDRLSSRDCVVGYKRTMLEVDLEDKCRIETGNFGSETAYRTAERILYTPATAVYAANDLIAIVVMRATNDPKRKVPEDIKIVSCDYDSNYEDLGYHLTAVKMSVRDITKTTMKAVIGMEKGGRLICPARLRKGVTA